MGFAPRILERENDSLITSKKLNKSESTMEDKKNSYESPDKQAITASGWSSVAQKLTSKEIFLIFLILKGIFLLVFIFFYQYTCTKLQVIHKTNTKYMYK